jgi:hypothetical protein
LQDSETNIHLSYGPFGISSSHSYNYGYDIYEAKNASRERPKLAVWFASNCVPTRTSLVRQLMDLVRVDSYGTCLNNVGIRPDLKYFGFGRKKIETLRQYRFAISMENSVCPEYVTEKVWQVTINVLPLLKF